MFFELVTERNDKFVIALYTQWRMGGSIIRIFSTMSRTLFNNLIN